MVYLRGGIERYRYIRPNISLLYSVKLVTQDGKLSSVLFIKSQLNVPLLNHSEDRCLYSCIQL